ncbi:MAG TPA: glycosyltransferase, partial [Clostridiaceae bacterium]|nr:glycosyltransferase [Clostridiaceae bacterium]
MAEKKRLSLCMVTFNDEKDLPYCLQNMKHFVDEIIIADIGSTDRTVDIAEQAGADVYCTKWNKDFSEAKNLCLEKANGKWILFLQPNEIISAEQLIKLNILLDDPNTEGYLLYIDRRSENYRISSPVESLRLFRNRKEYRYKYKAFECIPDICLANNIKDSGIRIIHKTDADLSYKIQLLNSLLQEDLNDHPEDSYLQYIYGIELLNRRMFKESIEYFQKALKNMENLDNLSKMNSLSSLFVPHLYKCLGWSLTSLQQYSNAKEVLEEGVKKYPFYTDLLVLKGDVERRLKQYESAVRSLEKCLMMKEQLNFLVPIPEIDVSVILEILGDVHEQLFNYQKALNCYQKSYEVNNADNKLLYKIAGLTKITGKDNILEEFFKETTGKKDIEKMLILMEIFYQYHDYSKVLVCLKSLESLVRITEQTKSIRISCLIMLGKREEAEFELSTLNKNSSFYGQILLQQIEYLWAHDKWDESETLLEEIYQCESIKNSVKALYQSLYRLFNENEWQHIDPMESDEYDIVNAIMEKFLWFGKIDKAKVLVPILLQCGKEEKYSELASRWIKQEDMEVIEMIFRNISNKELQSEFKRKIIEQSLRYGNIKLARKLTEFGDSQVLGELEYIFFARDFMERLKDFIKDLKYKYTSMCDSLGSVALYQTKTNRNRKVNRALLAFYYSLGLGSDKNSANQYVYSCDTDRTYETEEITNAEIHERIG